LIATAQNSIQLPKADFVQLGIHLGRKIPDLRREGLKMIGASPCQDYDLGNLTLTIDQMDYVIPSVYYTQTLNNECHFLFEVNNHEEPEIREKYILGLPFLKAFIVVFNYEKNSIGIANKVSNFGAEILGANAPGPRRWYYRFRDFDRDERGATFIPVDEEGKATDGWVRPDEP